MDGLLNMLCKKIFNYFASNKMFLILFFFSFAIFSFWLTVFYPGVMSTDSWDQWNQAMGAVALVDHHPFVHTLYIKFLTYFWRSPAAVAFFQIFLSSVLISYLIVFLQKVG